MKGDQDCKDAGSVRWWGIISFRHRGFTESRMFLRRSISTNEHVCRIEHVFIVRQEHTRDRAHSYAEFSKIVRVHKGDPCCNHGGAVRYDQAGPGYDGYN